MTLDPVVAAMLEEMSKAGGPQMTDMSPSDARAVYQVMQSTLPAPVVDNIEDRVVDTGQAKVPIRIYKAQGASVSPCIVFFHGGGWVIGDLTTHDPVCRQLHEATGYTVIAVDYRLAPEHRFPAAIDDCYAVTKWVALNADTLGIDAQRIAVAGDSAGGNLSASVCLKAKAGDSPAIAFQLLIYPVTDAAMDSDSYRQNGEGYLLSAATMQWFWQHYLGDQASGKDPWASPLLAADLSKLPPACIITAEYDPLRDEGEAYGRRLREAGVKTHIQRFDGMIHGFFGMTNMLEGSRDALALAASQLKTALEQ